VTSWEQARAAAAGLAPLDAARVPLSEAAGLVLADELRADADLPPFDASAMDGWAVAGEPPWRIVGDVTAGQASPSAVRRGEAVRVATGAPLPVGATAVVRLEHARADSGVLTAAGLPPDGTDIRLAGGECRAGDTVAATGQVVVPALLGLAAAAGADTVVVIRRPRVDVLVIGDELMQVGQPSGPHLRDALGPMLPPWLAAAGAAVAPARHLPDDHDVLLSAVAGSTADLVVTTGSTGPGHTDHLHGVLAELGAELPVDGVAVRPGHPMLLARLPAGRAVAGLPGNPLAAVSGLLTLVLPALRAMMGRRPDARRTAVMLEPVSGPPDDVRLLPIADGRPVLHVGPAMLRGLAGAEWVAVIPAGGVAAGTEVEVLALPGATPPAP
jgi:molybdopterin molybdotransferase